MPESRSGGAYTVISTVPLRVYPDPTKSDFVEYPRGEVVQLTAAEVERLYTNATVKVVEPAGASERAEVERLAAELKAAQDAAAAADARRAAAEDDVKARQAQAKKAPTPAETVKAQ